MKKILLLFILITHFSFSQIKGRIISAITHSKPIEEVTLFEKDTYNYIEIDSLGYFEYFPKKEKAEYILSIISDEGVLDYKYKSEWINRKYPKTIIIHSKCLIKKSKATIDFKKDDLQLYIQGGIAPISNTKKDIHFEKKYNITYNDIGCEVFPLECIFDYNKRAFEILDLTFGVKWRKKIRNDVLGFE